MEQRGKSREDKLQAEAAAGMEALGWWEFGLFEHLRRASGSWHVMMGGSGIQKEGEHHQDHPSEPIHGQS